MAQSPVGCSPLGRRFGHLASETADFVFVPSPSAAPHALRGVFADDARRVAASNARNVLIVRLARPGPPVKLSPRTFLTSASRLGCRDVRLHSLDVIESETAYEPWAKYGLDMRNNPAPTALDRRHLDRPTVAAEERAGVSLFGIPIADLLDGHADPDCLAARSGPTTTAVSLLHARWRAFSGARAPYCPSTGMRKVFTPDGSARTPKRLNSNTSRSGLVWSASTLAWASSTTTGSVLLPRVVGGGWEAKHESEIVGY